MSRVDLLIGLAILIIVSFSSNVQGRLSGEGIVGGDRAEDGKYPYQISLELFGRSICGGTIIGERHVITAAHCVTNGGYRIAKFPLKVVAGVSDLKSKAATRVAVDVVQVYTPKEYDPSLSYDRDTGDIAVLKLNEDLGIASNPNLGKADLPDKNEIHKNIEAVITGFGFESVDVVTDPITGRREEQNGYSSDKMRYAKSKVITTDECNKMVVKPVTSKHICAAVVQRDPRVPEGICSGDSGGPLVYENTLIGVVSTSPLGCREDSRPAVYTRVSYFVDFIQNAVEDNVTSDMRTATLKIWNFKTPNES